MLKLSLKQLVEQQIDRFKQDVFLRADFEKLGGYDQVGRALRQLVAEGKLADCSCMSIEGGRFCNV